MLRGAMSPRAFPGSAASGQFPKRTASGVDHDARRGNFGNEDHAIERMAAQEFLLYAPHQVERYIAKIGVDVQRSIAGVATQKNRRIVQGIKWQALRCRHELVEPAALRDVQVMDFARLEWRNPAGRVEHRMPVFAIIPKVVPPDVLVDRGKSLLVGPGLMVLAFPCRIARQWQWRSLYRTPRS
jgi:hypothetical protein